MTQGFAAASKLISGVGIEEIRQGAEANIDVSIHALDEQYGLAEVVKRCNSLLIPHLGSGVTDAERATSRAQFIQVVYKQSILAFLNILRGHVTESFFNLRLMIEAALFAALIERDPKRYFTWVNAGAMEDQESYEVFKREFSTKNAKRLGNHRIALLLRKYDAVSKHTHTSIYHISRSLKIETIEHEHEFRFQFFEYKKNDPTELRYNWLFAVETNIEVLDLFASWMPSTSKDAKFNEVFGGLKSEFEIAKAIWRPA